MIISEEQITSKEVTDWAGLHLLHFHGSSCSQKVRIMLGELELDWVPHPINLMRHQNSTNWFLGINPRGVVPVLVHNGVVHVESNDIISYLDTTFSAPESSYFFNESKAKKEIAQELLDREDSLHVDLRILTIQFGPLPIKNKRAIDAHVNNGQFDEIRNKEVRWWREKSNSGITENDTRNACKNFQIAFDRLDKRLSDRLWLMGEDISIVDISWFTNLYRLVNMGYPLNRHENLCAYYNRLLSRPAFKAELSNPGSRFGKMVFSSVKLINRLKGNRLEDYLA